MAESTERMYVSGLDVNDAGDIVFASRVYRKITAAGQTFAGYGNWDFMVIKANTEGKAVWARHWGGVLADSAPGIALREDGDFYLTGSVGALRFGEQRARLKGRTDAFLARFDPKGECRWTRNVGGRSWDWGQTVAVAPDGGAILGGASRSGYGEFGSIRLDSDDSWIGFLAKVDENGEFEWAKLVDTDGSDSCHSLAVTLSGRIYAAGYFGSGASGGSAILSTEAGQLGTVPAKHPEGRGGGLRPATASDLYLLCLER